MTREDKLTILDFGGEELLEGDHLRLVILVQGLRQLEDEETCVDLVDVLIESVVCLQDDEAVFAPFLVQVPLQEDVLRADVVCQVVD